MRLYPYSRCISRILLHTNLLDSYGLMTHIDELTALALSRLDSKYAKWYFQLMKKGLDRVKQADVYMERHHIIPRALGGNDASSNLTLLTPREHFVAHVLLIKITESHNKRKMCYALHKMMHSMSRLRPDKVYSKSIYAASRIYQGGLNTSPCSEKKRIANSKSSKAMWANPEKRAQLITAMKARASSEEAREAFKVNALKASTPAVNAKKSASAKARRWSDEVKQKMSEARKALYADPAKREQAITKSKATKVVNGTTEKEVAMRKTLAP